MKGCKGAVMLALLTWNWHLEKTHSWVSVFGDWWIVVLQTFSFGRNNNLI